MPQVRGVAGQRQRVADALMEAVVRSRAEGERLLLVSQEVVYVPELVVCSDEILFSDFDSHLQASIVHGAVGEVPRTGVANGLARWQRLVEERGIPESRRELAHA